jgi:hypothetical protein
LKRIPILARRGAVVAYTLVEDGDLEWLSESRWSLSPKGYVRRRKPDEFMHRVIAARRLGRALLPGEEVHHRHEDKLDNRWVELEVTSPLEHKARHHTNPGVRFCRKQWKWYARPTINGVKVWLGYQPNEATAIKVVEEARRNHAAPTPSIR